MPVTFNAMIEKPEPMTPPDSPPRIDLTTPEKLAEERLEPPPVVRQNAFRPTTCEDEAACVPTQTDWVEVGMYAACLATMIYAGYTLGYRHALENTLSNMLAEVA